jgi:putative oxidoreductase
MRRLFSTFAHGAPGVGLLLVRLAVGIMMISHSVVTLVGNPPFASACFQGFSILLGLLLLVGLLTSIAGVLAAMSAILEAILHSESWQHDVSVGILAAALMLLGPGVWSLDARRYGWKRITISEPGRKLDPPN